MIKQALLGEFLHESENTRKILKAIPDSALDWKPSEKNWTTAQLASHIAEVYNWYESTFDREVFDMGTYQYDKGDISKAKNIVSKFEENVLKAQKVLENSDESRYFDMWKMEMNGNILFPPTQRIQVIRGFLYNHLYHHRGELVVYLRSTGNKVPGLYGPTADDKK
ncbi:damage-inducible protein DinB [Chryseobacterium nematophagum]|uniref:Damage-inducible protein DinB n=1 Tax=Chryseobacterium nematophagum TaxID=2305228 RepID=A0A3M7LDP9_9FLAO|nr:DinB family protein [Chryseobacterium nematophagum]RMZ60120.1 damage-inducible protein DinB [Chryseobacterium nematophagum]